MSLPRNFLRCFIFSVSCLLSHSLTQAAVPALLNHQGRIAVNGVNFDGAGQFKFALVNANGSVTYWSNNGSSTAGSEPTAAVSLTVVKGLFNVLLGDVSLSNMTALPPSVFDNTDVRLRVWFNDGSTGFQLLPPDQRLTASPYSMVAASVPDGSITAAKIANGAVSNVSLTNSSFTITPGTGLSGGGSVALGGTVSISSNGTTANTPSTLVMRDASGNFSAGTIIGTFVGDGSGLTGIAGGTGGSETLLANIKAAPLKPIVAWGDNHDGQTVVPSFAPVQSIVAGTKQGVALLKSGGVVSWGIGPAVPVGLTSVVDVAAGAEHFLACKSDGTVVAWGNLIAVSSTAGLTPGMTVFGPSVNGSILNVLDSKYYVLSQSIDNPAMNLVYGATILSSTSNGSTTLTVLNTSGLTAGMAVSGPGITSPATIVSITNGTQFVLSQAVATATNDLAYGGSVTLSSTSNAIASGITTATHVAAGEKHSLALLANGTVVAWGDNTNGKATVPGTATTVTAIAAGYDHSLALKANGTVVAWGSNAAGQTTVPGGLTNVIAIAAGAYHSLALKGDGTVVAWGLNNGGQATVPGGLTNVTQVAGGYAFSLALKSDGSLLAWGDNTDGQTDMPADATHITAIATGASYALALRADLIPAQVARLDQANVFTANVGIKRTPTTNTLEVEGQASKSTAGSWLSNSDRRIKSEVHSLTGALDKLDQVRLVDFRYTPDYRASHPGIPDKRYLNVIAQEFAKVFPDHVQSSGEKLPDGSEILQVDTYPLTIYSAAAVQELHRENKTLKATLLEQTKKLADQEERLRRLEAAAGIANP